MGQSSSSTSSFAHTRFEATYAPTGRATCKHTRCKKPIEAGSVRLTRHILTKTVGNNDTGGISHHYHVSCGCEVAAALRCASKATQWADKEDATPLPELGVSPDLSPSDAKKVRAEFAKAREAMKRRCHK